MKAIERALREIDELERMLPLVALRATAVSGWSVGEQIEHVIAVGDSILDGLAEETRTEHEKPLRFSGKFVLLTGFIPRGRGRSPEKLRPSGIAAEELRGRLQRFRERLRAIRENGASLDTNRSRFNHPLFGTLDARQWVRFVDIHQHHHVKIVRDIAGAAVVAR
jgi:hypothetical protein